MIKFEGVSLLSSDSLCLASTEPTEDFRVKNEVELDVGYETYVLRHVVLERGFYTTYKKLKKSYFGKTTRNTRDVFEIRSSKVPSSSIGFFKALTML